MKTRHLVMGISLLACGWLAFFGDKTPETGIAESVTRSSSVNKESPSRTFVSAGRTKNARDMDGEEPIILGLRSREEMISRMAPEKESNVLFASHSWAPPPPPPPKPAPPPPPSAPPLPFTFLGKKVEDGKWEVFLARGEQTYIVHDQSTLENNYRVEAIKPPSLTLTYLPLNQVQTLYIGGID